MTPVVASDYGFGTPLVVVSMVKSARIVAANRLPIDPETMEISLGGLVTALMSDSEVTWIGAWDTPIDPVVSEGIKSVPAVLAESTYVPYYEGAANAVLWPAFHGLKAAAMEPAWWQSYVAANVWFANTIEAEIQGRSAIWVHDYHLFLVPQMLRHRELDATVGFFSHIPFPQLATIVDLVAQEILSIEQVTEICIGLLGADLIGFHIKTYSDNFLQLVSYLNLDDVLVSERQVQVGERTVKVAEFPIGIDPARYAQAVDSIGGQRLEQLRKAFDPDDNRTIYVGIDRLDYTKGIDHRLLAFQQMLREGQVPPEDVVMIQVAPPNRENVEAYKEYARTVKGLVVEIQKEFGEEVLHFIDDSIPLEQCGGILKGVARTLSLGDWPYSDLSVVELLAMADVVLVTAIADGMNLVAKEFVASQHFALQAGVKERVGNLVLSDGTGVAEQLGEHALVHKAGDVDDLKQKILLAHVQNHWRFDAKRLERMHNLANRVVHSATVDYWRDQFWSELTSD